MLAYVFWHTSRIDRSEQEANLVAFHETLAAFGPEGFISSAVFSCERLPWTPEDRLVYEDWYLVDDFDALGRLNENAVRGPRQPSHDEAARGSEWGAGGLYLLHSGSAQLEEGRFATWASKPDDRSYEEFYASIPARADIWRRQLVLSRGPEFCLRASQAVEISQGIVREMKAVWIGS